MRTAFLAGGGELGERMREFDWHSTPLGPPADWPRSLKTAVRIMLTSRQPVWIGWGGDLIYLYNDPYKSIIGGKHPRMLARPAAEVWSEIWSDIAPLLAQAMRGIEGTYVESQLLIMERSGYPEETYYTFSYTPIPDDDGGVGGIFCANTDDTQRVIGERRMALLRDLAARSGHARSWQDACAQAAEVIRASPRDLPFALIYTREPGEEPALAAACGLEPGRRAAPYSGGPDCPWPLTAALAGEQIILVEDVQHLELPPGIWRKPPGRVALVPLPAAGQTGRSGVLVVGLNPFRPFDDEYRNFLTLVAGQIAAALAAAQAYEEERRRAEAFAELDRAKTVFFSNVSHELRTPLTLMLAPLEDLLAKPAWDKSDGDGELVSVAHRNGLRLLKLVNALLDFSRIEAGRTRLAMQRVDLSHLTAELASVFRSAMEKAGLDLIVQCDPLSAPVVVDRDAWEKIVLNLLSNAFKYTLKGSVTVNLYEENGYAVLTVVDTGIGIPERELPHVFTRFHRVEGAQGRTHEGTGIGLSLIHELLKLHGGTVSVESREGYGSTFYVSLPLDASPAAADALPVQPVDLVPGHNALIIAEAERWLPAAAAESPSITPHNVAAGRIVLADDNADMRDYVRRLLEQDGYVVDVVPNGEAALRAMEARRPDLLLTDVMMPVMDGFALVQAVRAHSSLNDVAVMMLSARAGEEAKVEGLERGADDYLVKPFSAVELRARIRANISISRLRRATGERERALRLDAEAQRDRLTTVLGGIRDYFIVIDRDWRLEFVSDSWCDLTRYAREYAVGRTVWELFPSLTGTEWEAVARRVMETREGATLDYWYEPYGIWWDLRFTPAPGGGLSQLSVDISERKRSELERNQLLEAERSARGLAERATRLKDEFLATLSHELRTPLNAIAGWTYLLKSKCAGDEFLSKGIDVIERNTRVQTQLIADLLDMSRIVTGKMRLDVQRVELPVVINAAVESLLPAVQGKGVRLQTIVEPVTDPVHGDPGRIQQIVWNLLSNAIKFTPRGGRVQVVLARVNSHVEITVSDTGLGLRPEFIPHVFERFSQADASTARLHGGLGIGLALVKQLTELHGGRVRVYSEGEGRGSTFIVELPLAVLRGSDEPQRLHPRAAGAAAQLTTPPDLSGLTILVVDDEQDALDMVRRVLESAGLSVRTAGGADAAVALLQQESFDVLLSDIGMPGRDGYDFIADVRRRGIRTPAAALTAFARTEDKTRVMLAGYQAHVSKPVETSELFATIAALAGRTAAPADPPIH